MEIHITISPIKHRPGVYAAEFAGEVLCRSRAPFLAAARALLARGYPLDAVLIMRHSDSDHDSLRGRIGIAAGWMVEERRDGLGGGFVMISTLITIVFALIILGVIWWAAQQLLAYPPVPQGRMDRVTGWVVVAGFLASIAVAGLFLWQG